MQSPVYSSGPRPLARALASVACALLCWSAGAAHETRPPEPITPLPMHAPADARKVELGALLFSDTRLSRDNSRSCASCHDLSTNGATHNARDLSVDGAELQYNTTTVFNAALNFRLGWNGLFRTLEAHLVAAIDNPETMGGSMPVVVERLRRDPALVQRFRKTYGRGPDTGNIVDALAQFQRSLVTPGSRFDRWLEGDADALTQDELGGYHLFKALGCVSCHHGVNVGGNMFQRYGIFGPHANPDGPLVKVPSLRNVALTAPYFHEGDVETLDEAVRRMAAAQLNFQLTDEQTRLLVAFLGSLTGTYESRPLQAAP